MEYNGIKEGGSCFTGYVQDRSKYWIVNFISDKLFTDKTIGIKFKTKQEREENIKSWIKEMERFDSSFKVTSIESNEFIIRGEKCRWVLGESTWDYLEILYEKTSKEV